MATPNPSRAFGARQENPRVYPKNSHPSDGELLESLASGAINPTELKILRAIAARADCRFSEVKDSDLARAAGVSWRTVKNLVCGLCADGWIVRLWVGRRRLLYISLGHSKTDPATRDSVRSHKSTPEHKHTQRSACTKLYHPQKLPPRPLEERIVAPKPHIPLPGSEDGFFPSRVKARPPSVEAYDLADRLYKQVAECGFSVRGWSRKSWAREMQRVIDKLGFDRVAAAMDDHVKHLDYKYQPRAWCPESFYRKFVHIEKARERRQRDNPPPVPVSADAERIAERTARRFALTPAAAAELPGVAQRSLDAVRAFADRLRANAGTSRAARRAVDAGGAFGNPVQAVTDWLARRIDCLKRWEGWDGTLAKWAVWSPSGEYAHLIAGGGWDALREAAK